MNKKSLLELLSQGKTHLVIAQMRRLEPQLEEDIREEITQQSARFQSMAKEKRLGLLTYEEQTVQLAKINAALVELIRQLPEGPLPFRIRWQTLAKWGGLVAASLALLATIAEISGYTLRDVFKSKDKTEKAVEKPPKLPNQDTFTNPTHQVEKPQQTTRASSQKVSGSPNIKQITKGDKSPNVITEEGNVNINYGDWDSSSRKDTTKKNPIDTTKKQ